MIDAFRSFPAPALREKGSAAFYKVRPFLTRPLRLWYDPEQDFISLILNTSFTVKRPRPFLMSGNAGAIGAWEPKPAAADRDLERGRGLFRQKSFPAAQQADSSQECAAQEFRVSFHS
jgi:hypothetical protein